MLYCSLHSIQRNHLSIRSANLQDLSKGIKMIASLIDDTDDSNKLLDAARGLASAFSDMLKAAQEGSNGDKDVSQIAYNYPITCLS